MQYLSVAEAKSRPGLKLVLSVGVPGPWGESAKALLHTLAALLKQQHACGSNYLVGNSLSAADLYWAAISQMVAPLSKAVSPIPDHLASLYSAVDAVVRTAMDPILFEHRDAIYRNHIGLPLDY